MSECLDTGTRDQVLGKDCGAPSDPHPQFASSAAILQEVLDTFRLRELERGTTPARAAPPSAPQDSGGQGSVTFGQRPPTETR